MFLHNLLTRFPSKSHTFFLKIKLISTQKSKGCIIKMILYDFYVENGFLSCILTSLFYPNFVNSQLKTTMITTWCAFIFLLFEDKVIFLYQRQLLSQISHYCKPTYQILYLQKVLAIFDIGNESRFSCIRSTDFSSNKFFVKSTHKFKTDMLKMYLRDVFLEK